MSNILSDITYIVRQRAIMRALLTGMVPKLHFKTEKKVLLKIRNSKNFI